MLEGVKEPLQTSCKEIVSYTFRKFSLVKGPPTRELQRKKITFCLLMNKLNIISYVLFIPLMEGLQKESVPFFYDWFFFFTFSPFE